MENIEWNTEECMKNIESFANIELLPKEPEIFYFWKTYDAEWNPIPVISQEYSTFDYDTYYANKESILLHISANSFNFQICSSVNI